MSAVKRVLVVRYGAHGDALQASSLFPVLKREGWQVAVDTTPQGEAVLRHDPHIDMILVSDRAGVGDADWRAHLETRSRGFHRVIVLNEATEGALLKTPDRLDFHWPDAARRQLCAVNYVEFLHLVAGVPFAGNRQRFYATADERASAAQFKARVRAPLVVWVLAGSAQHKVWPGLPRGIVRVLQESDAHVVAVGGPRDREIAASVEAFGVGYHRDFGRRVTMAAGDRDVRAAMALAQAADVVVGPETGLLNAVAMEGNAKVVMLSHSSPLNLTRDWVNTVPVLPSAPCWPCHRLHRDTRHCPQDERTQRAACAASISVNAVVGPILTALRAAA